MEDLARMLCNKTVAYIAQSVSYYHHVQIYIKVGKNSWRALRTWYLCYRFKQYFILSNQQLLITILIK